MLKIAWVGLFQIIVFCLYSQNVFQKVQSKYLAMGTEWNIKIHTDAVSLTYLQMDSAWQYLELMDSLWSNYRSDSELSLVENRAGTGEWTELHPLSFKLYTAALFFSDLSQGMFDPTIGAATQMWRRAFTLQQWPSNAEITSVQDLVGYKKMKQEGSSVMLEKLKMQLDLGGIAKGYAVDQLLLFFKERGYSSVLIDGGGDICVSSDIGQLDHWNISVDRLDISGQIVSEVLPLQKGCIATSGNSFQYIEHDGDIYQHHIDPATSLAIKNVHRVTVYAESGLEADAISTLLSIEPNFQLEYPNFRATVISGRDEYVIKQINF